MRMNLISTGLTISSVIVRGLHRILAARLDGAFAIDPGQRGFRMNIDGCRDNVFQPDYILKQCHQTYLPLYMASVDHSFSLSLCSLSIELVRQCDPLSSTIFNMLTHRMLEALPSEVGIKIGDRTANASTFVDDGNSYATTSGGLQMSLDRVVGFLAQLIKVSH